MIDNIKYLIKQKENRKLEFKETLPNNDKIIKTAIAFSNSQGGNLIIDKEKLGLGYSELRNPNLGYLFKKLELIEQWGSGYEKIQKELKLYPEIKLEIDDDSTFTQVKFIKKDYSIKNGGVNGGVNRVYEFIKNNPNLRLPQISQNLNIPKKTLEKQIKKLKDENKIEFRGSPKTGGYVIKG